MLNQDPNPGSLDGRRRADKQKMIKYVQVLKKRQTDKQKRNSYLQPV